MKAVLLELLVVQVVVPVPQWSLVVLQVPVPALRLLVLHDDAEREFDYTAGAEQALEHAAQYGWTVVSLKSDWVNVFAD